jgi:hypothetical protein
LSFSFGNILVGLIFGGIGFVAFVYGKKNTEMRPLFLGLALMVYPYFIPNPWAAVAVGVVLTALIFYPK